MKSNTKKRRSAGPLTPVNMMRKAMEAWCNCFLCLKVIFILFSDLVKL